MVGRAAKRGKTGIPRWHDQRLPTRADSEKITVPANRRSSKKHAQVPSVVERSKHQDKIIRNYYQNRDAIALQRLGELVTELYLAEGKARERKWKNVVGALEKLKIPPARIAQLEKQDNPALVAKLLEELLAKK
jgi:hypothetical protein